MRSGDVRSVLSTKLKATKTSAQAMNLPVLICSINDRLDANHLSHVANLDLITAW